MSAPDDLIGGAVKYLAAQPEVLAALGSFPDGKPYLFQRSTWVNLEGSQATAATLFRAGGWAGPNQHNSMRFPRLGLEISADPQRDAANNPAGLAAEAELRLVDTFNVIDRFLHRPQSGVQMWGTVRTIGCARLAEPAVFPVPDGGGMMRLRAFYGVIEG